ncbi:protein HGH1 homolog [Malurus melanocephalus]|uniref:protein HGH1 homolog n=1 Tax=Malurus melanocephalus TaxID=175006 RepID=UPI002546E4EF|nr:protein HGH1 homolog [Malurus melanocephalus]
MAAHKGAAVTELRVFLFPVTGNDPERHRHCLNATAAVETNKAAIMADATNEASAAAAALSELTALLSPSSPAAPQAAEAALALSGSDSGRALLAGHPAALSALAAMAASASSGAHTALAALVNASAEPAALEPLLAAFPTLLPLLPSSGAVCGIAANLSRDERAAPRVLKAMGAGAEALLRALSAERPPEELGALLCNLSQAREGRRLLLERSGALSAARPPAELGALLCNLSQAREGRRLLLERSG